MILTNSGVLKLMQRIKSYIASQLNTKAPSVHTHTISEIDNLSSQLGGGYTKSEVDTLLTGKADSSHTHTKSQITDFPSYGTTANSICEGNDSRLSDARTPTSHTHTKSEITDFPSLSTVATSGSYSDLSDKPTIPTVNNATLTIQKNGTTVKTFTANASSDVTCNITVPTKTSDLTNDSGFLTSHQSLSNYSTLSNTIKSLSISGKTITYTKGDDTTGTLTTQDTVYTHPTSSGNKHIPSGGSSGQFLGWSADGTAKWVNNPNTNTWTAMVGATSSSNGSVGYVNAVPPKDGYNTKYLRADGTWQVPPDHTYNVYNKTLTIQKNGTNVATFTSNSNTDVTCNISVPTKTSDLTNDSGFLTSHQDLSGYIPLSGTNALSGNIIPSTDNTYNLGNSNNKFKSVKTNSLSTFQVAPNTDSESLLLNHDLSYGGFLGSGLVLRGKNSSIEAGCFNLLAGDGTNSATLQGTPSGTLTWGGKNIDCVEEQTNASNGYIRYTNGIQICWGGFMNNNNIGAGQSSYTFPKAFNAEPRIIVTTNLLDLYLVTTTASTTTFSVGFIQCYQTPVTFTQNNVVFNYIAIGTWK